MSKEIALASARVVDSSCCAGVLTSLHVGASACLAGAGASVGVMNREFGLSRARSVDLWGCDVVSGTSLGRSRPINDESTLHRLSDAGLHVGSGRVRVSAPLPELRRLVAGHCGEGVGSDRWVLVLEEPSCIFDDRLAPLRFVFD